VAQSSGSILRKLEVGFGCAALLLAGLMALFMDHALHASLEAEDAQVMADQARALAQQLAAGRVPLRAGERPQLEKAEWRVLDRSGRILAQSAGMASVPPLPAPDPDGEAREVPAPDGRIFTLLVRTWRGSDGEPGGRLFLAMDRSHEEILVARFRRTLALAVALATLAAVLVARLVAVWGLAPLRRIIREAGAIDDRHLETRLAGEHFPAELQELVATLNAALARLQAAFERTGRLGAELAHELRTPLQNLRSTLENQALGPGCPESQRALLGGLLEDCDHMAALIDQILFLARAEAGPAPLAREPLDLPELLEEVRAFFEAAAEEVSVNLQVMADPGSLLADRLLLTRALHNLVANALRHTPPGGTVTLGAETGQAGALIWVEDTGRGISPEWLPRLGRPFVRPPGQDRGLGLGLAIVARIAVMLGGSLELQSEPGRGTRATLNLT
jgi:two-component system heavy metal sensor histidine kinase CusS